MLAPRTPAEKAAHTIRLYARGIICPSEMWRTLQDALSSENVTALLDELPDDRKCELIDVYIGRPPRVYADPLPDTPDQAPFREASVRIVQWCEATCAQRGLSTIGEPGDGLLRVMIQNGGARAGGARLGHNGSGGHLRCHATG